MKQPKQLVDIITEGIREKKGRSIVIADLNNIEGAIANYLIICQGNSPTQVGTVPESIGDTIRKDLGEKSVNVIGLGANQQVAIGFIGVLVHVFLLETRIFYDLKNFWEDARLTRIPDQD